MTLFENYLEREIDALGEQSGTSDLSPVIQTGFSGWTHLLPTTVGGPVVAQSNMLYIANGGISSYLGGFMFGYEGDLEALTGVIVLSTFDGLSTVIAGYTFEPAEGMTLVVAGTPVIVGVAFTANTSQQPDGIDAADVPFFAQLEITAGG